MTMIQKRRFRLNMVTGALLALLAAAPLLAYRAVARGQASQPASAPAAPVVKVVPVAPPVAVVQPAAPTALQGLLDALLKIVGIAAATAVPLLLKRWLGAKVSTETLAQLTTLAGQGVAAGEEAAHQQVKLGRARLSGPEKMEVAARYVVETADRLGLVGVAQNTVKSMVESQLGTTRGEV